MKSRSKRHGLHHHILSNALISSILQARSCQSKPCGNLSKSRGQISLSTQSCLTWTGVLFWIQASLHPLHLKDHRATSSLCSTLATLNSLKCSHLVSLPTFRPESLSQNRIEYYINVKDDARLHVAALTFEDVANERIFAMADKFKWKYVFTSLNRCQ